MEMKFSSIVSLLIGLFFLIACEDTPNFDAGEETDLAKPIVNLGSNPSGSTSNESELFSLDFENGLLTAESQNPTQSSEINYTNGIFGTGSCFGTSDVLQYPSHQNINYEKGSVSVWIKPDRDPGAQLYQILYYGRNPKHFEMHIDEHKQVVFGLNSAEIEGLPIKVAYADVSEWSAGEWHHIVYTWSSDVIEIYLDGFLAAKQAVGFDIPLVSDTIFHAGSTFGREGFNGVIDELKIFEEVLTTDEVLFLYDAHFRSIGDPYIDNCGGSDTQPVNLIFKLDFENVLTTTENESPELSSDLSITEGINGNGICFGKSDTLQYASLNNIEAQNGTVSMWVKPNWYPGGILHKLLQFGIDENRIEIHIDEPVNGRAVIGTNVAVDENGPINSVEDIPNWIPGEWHHLAFSWSSESLRVFIDGEIRNSVTTGFELPEILDDVFHIGSVFGIDGFDGVIDEIEIYDHALSTGKINQLYSFYSSNTRGAYVENCGEEHNEDVPGTNERLFHLNFENGLINQKDESPLRSVGIEFTEGIDSTGICFGSDDVLTYSSDDNIDYNQGAVSVWVKPSWTPGGVRHNIFYYGVNQRHFEFHIDENAYIAFGVNSFDHNLIRVPFVPVNNWEEGEWHHLVITWSADRSQIFVDGVLAGSDTSGAKPRPVNDPEIHIGSARGENGFEGVLDELSIFNYELSTEEVGELYQLFASNKEGSAGTVTCD